LNLSSSRKYYNLKVREGSIVYIARDIGDFLYEVLEVDIRHHYYYNASFNMSRPRDFVYAICFFGPLTGSNHYIRVVDRFEDDAKVIRY